LKLLHFGSNPAELDIDLDGDGVKTLLEFAFNSDPTDASSNYIPALVLAVDAGGQPTAMDFVFRRWRESNGITYEVQYTQDLGDWTGDAFTAEIIGTPVANGDGTETVTYRVTPSSPGDNNFLRLRVSE
jgi:hypothetical protein